MRFLVTGASGFVGLHLVSKLFKLEADVKSISFSKMLKDIKNTNESTIAPNELLKNVDVLVHLAARVHVMNESADDPLATFSESNLYGTVNLAHQAALAGISRFVYVSSIKVNGEYTCGNPFNESDGPAPMDPYAISKWQAELALHEISSKTGMEIVVLRPPLIYGPGVKANFYSLIKLVDGLVPLPLGSITNTRSMIYVGNLVDALIQCATHPNAAGKTFLVSDGEDVSTPQLVMMIAAAMKKPNKIFRFPIPIMRLGAALLGRTSMVDRLTQSLVVDSSKIRDELAWTPPYTMSRGIEDTVQWYLKSKHSHDD